jgi:hypothetical protein
MLVMPGKNSVFPSLTSTDWVPARFHSWTLRAELARHFSTSARSNFTTWSAEMSHPAAEKRSSTAGSGSNATPTSRTSWKLASMICWTAASDRGS